MIQRIKLMARTLALIFRTVSTYAFAVAREHSFSKKNCFGIAQIFFSIDAKTLETIYAMLRFPS